MPTPQPARRAIATFLERVFDRLRKRPSLYLVVLALSARDEEVRRRYQRVEQIAIERLAALIEFGQRQSLMRADIDPQAAAFLIHHSLDMAMVQLLLREQTGPAPERVLAELTELFSRYVQKEPP